MNSRVILSACMLVTAAMAANNIAYAAQTFSVIERSDDDLVLVDIQLERTLITEALPGYAGKSSLMLPLGALAKALEFSMAVSPQEGTADGWVVNADTPFHLDLTNHEVQVDSSRSNFSEGQVEAHADDIYVDTALLKEWLQVDFDFSFANQTVTLLPRNGVKLPIQLRTEREEARSALDRAENRAPEGPFPRVDVPYQAYTNPFTDLTYNANYDERSYSGTNHRVTALASGDLLYMHSNTYAAYENSRDFSDLRLTLSRRDPDGELFQPDEKLYNTRLGEWSHDMELREVSFGDISTPQVPLTAFNQQGRGVIISNIPYDRATQYDRTTLQGDVQPGWEVELYRNDELLSFQRSSNNGRYEFVDVPLLSGLNILRLVFYGPFGQTREEVRRFLVTPELTQAGKSYFRASLSQQNTSSFDTLLQNQNQYYANLSSATPLQTESVRGEPRAMLEYEYGVLDNLSFFSSATHLTTADAEKRTYLSTGLGTTLGGAFGRADIARDVQNGGNAVKFALQDNLDGISLSADHQQFFDFISEHTESVNDPVVRRSNIRADAPLTLPYLPRLNNGVSAAQVVYDSEREVNQFSFRTATAVNRLAVSNSISYITDSTPTQVTLTGVGGLPVSFTTREEQTNGEFILSFPWREIILRGNILYGLSPEREVQTLLSSAEYNFTRDTSAIFQIDHQFVSDRVTNYTVGLNRKFDQFLLGGNIGRSSRGDNVAGISLSLSFGEDPRTGKFNFYPDYTAGNGLISARAYHDINNNNVFDDDDKPLEDARFLVNRGSAADLTNADGAVLIRNTLADSRSSLTLDAKSIDNPYLLPAQQGVDVVTRPGVVAMVDYPIHGTGDVEGTVRIMDETAETREASNVQVQLFTPDGKLLRETQTSFDGYYLMNGVPAGNYTVRISINQAARLGFITPPDRAVSITQEESDSRTVDMEIIRLPESENNEVQLPNVKA